MPQFYVFPIELKTLNAMIDWNVDNFMRWCKRPIIEDESDDYDSSPATTTTETRKTRKIALVQPIIMHVSTMTILSLMANILDA